MEVEGDYYLIDWEECCFGDPHYDLAFVYFFWRNQFKEFLREYGKINWDVLRKYFIMVSMKKYVNRYLKGKIKRKTKVTTLPLI